MIDRSHRLGCTWVVVSLLILALPSAVSRGAPVLTSVIAVTGDPVPSGSGSFTSLYLPALNNGGEVAFASNFAGTGGAEGIFSGRESALVTIARKGQPAPGAGGAFSGFYDPALSVSGAAAFYAGLSGTDDNTGIFRGTGSKLSQIARKNQVSPDGDGRFSGFGLYPGINAVGEVSFYAALTGSSTGGSGIFVGDGATIVPIVRSGHLAPDGNGTFSSLLTSSLRNPLINDAGQVVFAAALTATINGIWDSNGIFRGDGSGLVQLARGGQPSPSGNGSLLGLLDPSINAAGEAAFVATLRGTSGGSTDDRAILRGDGVSLVQIARKGQLSADGNGRFSFLYDPALNSAGQVAFLASLTQTAGASTDNAGIFRGDGAVLATIARKGQAIPNDVERFSSFAYPALNEAGQVAFYAEFSGGAGIGSGVFLFDDSMGLLTVARKGDPLLQSTITALAFFPSLSQYGNDRSGLNDAGQVSFWFRLADGREGIALATVPEPAYSVVIVAALILVLGHRQCCSVRTGRVSRG